jgi:hypothetical protein
MSKVMVRGYIWFRLFGWGIWAASFSDVPPSLGEQSGRIKVLHISAWRFGILRPEKPFKIDQGTMDALDTLRINLKREHAKDTVFLNS